MMLRGESANLLSVGAIDFGLIVDATVIMVENIFRHLVESAEARRAGGALLHVVRGSDLFRGKFAVIANAATEVNQAIFFAAAIIIAGFVPLFTLTGVEGHIFGPDGADLCLCHRGRPDRDLHHLAGAVRAAAARQRRGDRDAARARPAPRL